MPDLSDFMCVKKGGGGREIKEFIKKKIFNILILRIFLVLQRNILHIGEGNLTFGERNLTSGGHGICSTHFC